MNTIELHFFRYKLNEVKCSCGFKKLFTHGIDARYHAENHEKSHFNNGDPVELLAYNNSEPVFEGRTAKPGRHAGGVVHQNLY